MLAYITTAWYVSDQVWRKYTLYLYKQEEGTFIIADDENLMIFSIYFSFVFFNRRA
jgi:hypothetical protein